MKIKEVLIWGKNKLKAQKIISAELDAEILLINALSKSREWLYSHLENELSKNKFKIFQKLILRRAKLEPTAYITGIKGFYSLEFIVDKNVLIPRPETEILVNIVLEEITKSFNLKPNPLIIADIGTGSGNISVAIATKIKNQKSKIKIYASDISKNALKVARQNAKIHHVQNKIKFIKSNLWQNFPAKIKFDLICANLPYLKNNFVKTHKNLKFEPKIALAAGKNGLEIYRKFFQKIKNYLQPKTQIYLEIDPRQTNLIKNIIKKQLPKAKIQIIKDLSGKNRIAAIYLN